MNSISICANPAWIGENYCLTIKECDVVKYINFGIDFFRLMPALNSMRGILRRSYV